MIASLSFQVGSNTVGGCFAQWIWHNVSRDEALQLQKPTTTKFQQLIANDPRHLFWGVYDVLTGSPFDQSFCDMRFRVRFRVQVKSYLKLK